jgi:iron(III) transport system substrate-binding protein
VAFMLGSKELTATTELAPPYRSGKSLELLQGMAAFYEVGTFSPRTDMPVPPGGEMWPTAKRLEATPEFQRDNIAKISDFWIVETSR